jgi:putative tryptophan/tyrosine transport system substrate-binding protein
MMRRREFIAGLGSAAAWPLAARAQQAAVPVIGYLGAQSADDEFKNVTVPFLQGLKEAGYVEGQNVEVEYRWAENQFDRLKVLAADLVRRHVAVIVAAGISGKWPELLKQIAPSVRRVAVLRNPSLGTGTTQFAVIQALAPSLRMEVTPVDARDIGEIERAVTAFARGSNGGLIVTSSTKAQIHREQIIMLAARHRLPAVYPYRFFITSGGLISYGPDTIDQYRLAAGYVDRILKGEKPADLPVQQVRKFELIINLKTAKALDLTIPETLLATADELIQ